MNGKKSFAALVAMAAFMASSFAFADADDAKWIGKCIKDNKKEGATATVVKKYCECMNSKMDDAETKTITQWEATHPDEMKACEAAAGWK